MTTIQVESKPLLFLWFLFVISTLGLLNAKELKQSSDRTFDGEHTSITKTTTVIGVTTSNLSAGSIDDNIAKLQRLAEKTTRQKTKSGLIIEGNARSSEFNVAAVDSDIENQEKHESRLTSSTVPARKRNKTQQQHRKRNGHNGQKRKMYKDGKYRTTRAGC